MNDEMFVIPKFIIEIQCAMELVCLCLQTRISSLKL